MRAIILPRVSATLTYKAWVKMYAELTGIEPLELADKKPLG
ncbi:hypothetical protein [Priestia koreensis]